uniref:Uncharacterized protein n=2 Tax=Aegilops tauschii subsp. strangulata TaxID=200361 RepID=A0A453P952_AEGTS
MCMLTETIYTEKFKYYCPTGSCLHKMYHYFLLSHKSVCFSSFSISFCPRVCNNVADALATHGSKMVHMSQVVWPGPAPNFIRDLIA